VQQVEVGCFGVVGDGGHDKWKASPSVAEQPAPEGEVFAAAAGCAPGTAPEREVQDNDGVGGGETYFEGVVGAEVAVKYPVLGVGELLLDGPPLVFGGRCEIGGPEVPVEFDDRQAGGCAEAGGEGGLSRAAAAQYHDSGGTPEGPGRVQGPGGSR
jgi:hypothetical protein